MKIIEFKVENRKLLKPIDAAPKPEVIVDDFLMVNENKQLFRI